jgi:hypothetical protein
MMKVVVVVVRCLERLEVSGLITYLPWDVSLLAWGHQGSSLIYS